MMQRRLWFWRLSHIHPKQPHEDAVEPWEAQREAHEAQIRAQQQYEQAHEIAERLRREQQRNNFAEMFRQALRRGQ